jgi:integrase/recombinase XerC
VRAAQKHGAPRDRALLALLLHAGLRVSEAVNLKVRDVVIRERSGHVAVRRGKGEKYREVPLNATARKMIQEWLGDHPGGEHLFPGRNGGPVTPRAIQKRLKELGRLAGVEVTPHRLRHTFCKMLVDAGESLDRVAVLAGHANLNTTARYTRPGMDDLERAVEKLAWDWVHASVMNVQGGNGCIQSVHPCFTKNRQNAPDFNRGMNGEKQKRLLSRAFSFFAVAFRGEEVKSGGSDDDP